MQGRSQTLETLLALTTAELQQVKSKQQPLKARNDLLEGLIGTVTANNQTVPAGLAKASPTVAEVNTRHISAYAACTRNTSLLSP